MYIKPERLKALLIDLKRTKQPSAELCAVLEKIVWGIGRKRRYPCDLEDATQEFVILVMKVAHRIDVNQSCFNYLTTLAINLLRTMSRRKKPIYLADIEKPFLETWKNLPKHKV